MMRHALMSAMAAAVTVWSAGSTHAQNPVYSFETSGPDGFFGLGATATQEPTIGVTHLENSLKYEAGAGGFVGVRTETVIPANLNNPPGVSYVLLDMFIPDPMPVGLTFADMGVTIFGHDTDNGVFGIQNQFTDTISIAGLGPGQHNNLRIDLDSEFFSGQSFNDIFGDDSTDLDVASAFQFYISKNAGVPLTVYIDNVRLAIPEPATAMMLGLGAIIVGVSRRRRK